MFFIVEVFLIGEIGDEYELYYVQINIDYIWFGDFDIYLIFFFGIFLELIIDNGFGVNYYNICFQDGELFIMSGMLFFEGKFQVEGGFIVVVFDGEFVNGIWKLEICDDVCIDKGIVVDWFLGFILFMCNDVCQWVIEFFCGIMVSVLNELLMIVDSLLVCFEEVGQGVWYIFQGNGEIGVFIIDNFGIDFDICIFVYVSLDGCEGDFICVLLDDDGGMGNMFFLYGII